MNFIEQAKKVLARHSSLAAAGRELGLTKKALSKRFRRQGLFAANYLAKVAIPEGMRLKQITTLLDDHGRIVQQSKKSELEAKVPPRQAIVPEGHLVKGVSSYVGPQGDIRGQWIKTNQDAVEREKAFLEACKKATARYRGLAPQVSAPARTDRDLHVVIPIGDPHVGMMSWAPETGNNFDLRIAERELFAVIDDLVERSPAAKSATLLNLGDFFHAQDDKQVTPQSGHKLDVDGRAAKVREVGVNLMRRLIDRMLRKFERVRAPQVPGNHDPWSAQWMALWLRAVYENEPRIEIPSNTNPFFYWMHGKNLFGTTHGDGVHLKELPGIMATDEPKMWGRSTHRFWHTGHVHHDSLIEVQNTLIHTWRTLAPNDGWAHKHGYRSGKSLCAIAYAREGGEVSRVSVDLGCVQRRITARAA